LWVTSAGYTIEVVDAWTFIWLMLCLKIPVVALFLLVRWAVRQGPETAGEDGGIGPLPDPHPYHPYHPRPSAPRRRRRGPHGEPAPMAPARVRAQLSHRRLTHS
jgi:hypothetical protein